MGNFPNNGECRRATASVRLEDDEGQAGVMVLLS